VGPHIDESSETLYYRIRVARPTHGPGQSEEVEEWKGVVKRELSDHVAALCDARAAVFDVCIGMLVIATVSADRIPSSQFPASGALAGCDYPRRDAQGR